MGNEGLKDNHAELPTAPSATVEEQFSQISIASTKPDSTVRFLSRYDRSATISRDPPFGHRSDRPRGHTHPHSSIMLAQKPHIKH